MMSGIAIVTCLCVCIFTALHLVYLAPMKCRSQRNMITQFPTYPPSYATRNDAPDNRVTPTSDHRGRKNRVRDFDEAEYATELFNDDKIGTEINLNSPRDITGFDNDDKKLSNGLTTTISSQQLEGDSNISEFESSGFSPHNNDRETVNNKIVKREDNSHFDDEDSYYDEGSGTGANDSESELLTEQLELLPVTSDDILTVGYDLPIHIEIVFCVCESWNGHWKRTFRYRDLSCLEVNRVLPVLSVATCTVTAGGAVLSGVILYLLWAAKDTFYEPARPSEIRPFIFSSNLRRNNSLQSKANGVPVWNGNGSSVRNGHSRYDI